MDDLIAILILISLVASCSNLSSIDADLNRIANKNIGQVINEN